MTGEFYDFERMRRELEAFAGITTCTRDLMHDDYLSPQRGIDSIG